jgi:hypothetical protein
VISLIYTEESPKQPACPYRFVLVSPNTCALRIICTASIPAITTHAVAPGPRILHRAQADAHSFRHATKAINQCGNTSPGGPEFLGLLP